jgi:hypothetical protein
MLGRVEKRSKGRVEPKQPTSIRISSVAVDASVLTVTYNQPIVLKGTPGYTTDVPGATAVSATSPSINVVEITFSAAIAAATVVNIPVADHAIRNKVGGFVADTTFPVGP